MKKKLFPGAVLIGFGTYFFMQQSQITPFEGFYAWPTLLIIVGISFLFQGYGAKDNASILPGIILTGLGLHFHIEDRFDSWPDDIGIFILIISVGFFLYYQKTKEGLLQGLLFFSIAILLMFYEQVTAWLGLLENNAATLWKFWPVVLVGFGLYLFLATKKKE